MDGGGGKKPVAQLRFALRKAFAECDEIVFSWEEASVQTLQVLRSLLNATERMNDFVAAEGKLGVLSAIPDAENNLKMKLVQSMERLRNAARSLLESFPELCVKVENLVDTTLSQQKELQAACTVEELWEAEHKAQPSIAQMLEWVYDVQVELRKELGLREHMLQGINHDSVQKIAAFVDIWQASTYFDVQRYYARSDAVKIHGT